METPFTRAIARYIQHMTERNFSAMTVEQRQRYLARFREFCQERGIEDPNEVSRPVVERYQRHMFEHRKCNGEPLAFETQATRLGAVKSFFTWMVRANLLQANPAGALEFPLPSRKLPRNCLSIEEVELILNQTNITTALGIRDRAILETFYATGLRRMELCHLGIHDVDFQRGTVFVRLGKGKKDRVVPIGPRAIRWVQKYLYDIRPDFVNGGDNGTLFLTVDGNPFTLDAMTTLAGQYVKGAELGKPGARHIFRHTCATLMLENGADVRFVQAQLGHEKLDTTMLYTHVAINMLKEVHRRTHPAGRDLNRTEPWGNPEQSGG